MNIQRDIIRIPINAKNFLSTMETHMKMNEEMIQHTISSPGRQVSQRSPRRRISFERGIRPGGTVPGLS